MKPRVIILGAGPAGLGAAFQLSARNLAGVTVLEQRDTVGGNAGSFELEGVHADYGSHRLHPSCDARIMADLSRLLGDGLLRRPRHGRICLQGRWIHFPLKPLDLLKRLPPAFALGAGLDMLTKPFRKARGGQDTFASVLERGLGRTICRDFYFPYGKKIWGVEPTELSPVQALRRVSANSPLKMLRKAKPGKGFFFYPSRGFGAISECLRQEAVRTGATLRFNSRITRIEREGHRILRLHSPDDVMEADYVWSTAPITWLAKAVDPPAPAEVLEAASRMRFRAMILIYLVLEQKQFTEYDAHYFPDARIPISRLSEPKNYSATDEPRDTTVLCAELPCDAGSEHWGMTDAELGDLARKSLEIAGIPVRAAVRRIVTKRLERAYPLYDIGYEKNFEIIDQWLDRFDNLLTFGRQGLFAHDNTHHALFMAYSAADCFSDTGFDHERWKAFRREFESHVVED